MIRYLVDAKVIGQGIRNRSSNSFARIFEVECYLFFIRVPKIWKLRQVLDIIRQFGIIIGYRD